MRIRRLPAIAAVGALAVAGLVGCRSDPSVAAYVDDVTITEASVDAVVDDLRAELGGGAEPAPEGLDDQLAAIRPRVIEMRVLTAAARQYAADEGIEVPEPAVAQAASELGLRADSQFPPVLAEFRAALVALQGTIEPVEPTEADQREIYDHLVEDGLTQAPFEEAQSILTQELVGEAVAMRDIIAAAVDRADITVNPRYQLVYEVPVPMGGAQSWLDVPLGDSPVVEAG